MARVVLDTNVLVSGVIASGHSARILDSARQNKITLVTSPHLLAEFNDVISRRRITRKYSDAAVDAQILLDFMRASCVIVSGIPQGEGVSRDQDDDFVLACAIDGEADYIVSGDPHLLDLKKYKGVLILSPREFVEQVLAKIL